MKQGDDISLADHILKWAKAIMPSNRATWVQAMASEVAAITGRKERLSFALGCLMAAVHELGKTRTALTWIGRSLVAFGLLCISAYGFFLAPKIVDYEALSLLHILCTIYAVAALLALLSLRALGYYAIVGLLTAAVCGIWFSRSLEQLLGLPSRYLAALSFEAGLLMAALLFAAIYLSLLSDRLSNDPDHA